MGERFLVLEGTLVVYTHPEDKIEVFTGDVLHENPLEILDVSPSQIWGEGVDVELWKSAERGVIVRILGTKLYSDGERYIIRG